MWETHGHHKLVERLAAGFSHGQAAMMGKLQQLNLQETIGAEVYQGMSGGKSMNIVMGDSTRQNAWVYVIYSEI